MKAIKCLKQISAFVSMVLLLAPATAFAQDYPHEDSLQTIAIHSRGLQRIGNTFESTWLIDNQTVMVPLRKTVQFDINHRFGVITNGYEDFFGLYAPSNIRLAFGYTPINNLMVGFGFTKFNMLWDFNIKYAILKEKGKNPMPVSVTYFGNMAVDSRNARYFKFPTDRFSYFHQIMVARKVTRDFSVQGSFSLSHMNAVEAFINDDGEKQALMQNGNFTFSALARYKISDATAFIFNYDQPLTNNFANNPLPNLAVGIELATPLHAFQVFIGNYQWLVPQFNNTFNQNDFTKGQFLIGFNITRLLDVQEEDMGDMMFKRKYR